MEKPLINTKTDLDINGSPRTDLRNEILKTLLYFDIFNYPLTTEEIKANCSYPILNGELEETLDQLKEDKLVKSSSGFYYVPKKVSPVERRQIGNKLAGDHLNKAWKMS